MDKMNTSSQLQNWQNSLNDIIRSASTIINEIWKDVQSLILFLCFYYNIFYTKSIILDFLKMKTRRNSKAAEIEKLPPTTSDSKHETKKQPKKTKSESKEKSLLIEKPTSKDTKKLPKGETKAIDKSGITQAPKEKKKESKKRKNKKENEVNDELSTAAKLTKKSDKGDSKNNTRYEIHNLFD